jgi:hypothetical protein
LPTQAVVSSFVRCSGSASAIVACSDGPHTHQLGVVVAPDDLDVHAYLASGRQLGYREIVGV